MTIADSVPCRWCVQGLPFRWYRTSAGQRVHLNVEKTHAIGECTGAAPPLSLADLIETVYRTARDHGAAGLCPESPEGEAAHRALRAAQEVLAASRLRTVGAALADPRVQADELRPEWLHQTGVWRQAAPDHYSGAAAHCAMRSFIVVASGEWSCWSDRIDMADLALPCRLVPVEECDDNPFERALLREPQEPK